MDEQSIINRRIQEVKADSDRLRAKLAENDSEMAELEAAANVIARLTGVKTNKVGSAVTINPKKVVIAKKSRAKPDGLPTMPQLIIMALKHEKRPLEPREITNVIRRNWWPEVEGQKIGSIVWRLNNRGDIQKVEGTSTYALPQKNEAPDESLGGQSEASLFETPAQGREAGPGGGP
jgi:hypothetical protein